MNAALKRWTVVALVLALALVGIGVAASGAGKAEVALAGVAGEKDTAEGTAGEPGAEPAGAAGEAATDAATDAADEDGAKVDAAEGAANPDREALLARWDELMQERQRLRAELRRVERELIAIARELWPHEWERARSRILERLREYEERIGEYGDEISSWLPPALVERIAERTGKTPEEVLELIETGQWRELFSRQTEAE